MLLSATLAAIPAPVDVENVPVERVIANLERQVTERPTDAELRVNLARVHAMAYAEKVTTIPSATVRGGSITIVPYLGLIPEFRPFEVKPSTDPKVTAIAREHLTKAIARYREALEIAPSNRVAKLGLGWTLIQAGKTAEAMKTLRELVAQSQAKDQRDPFVVAGFRSLTEEAIRYLVPLLDPMRDRAEIDRCAPLKRSWR